MIEEGICCVSDVVCCRHKLSAALSCTALTIANALDDLAKGLQSSESAARAEIAKYQQDPSLGASKGERPVQVGNGWS